MTQKLKQNNQKYLLESEKWIFHIIIQLGGQIHRVQLVRWLSGGSTKSAKVDRLISACIKAGLLKTFCFHHNQILHVTYPVYQFFNMKQRRYKVSSHRLLTGSLIMEKYLFEGYDKKEPLELAKRLQSTTARYGYSDAMLEYCLLDSLIKRLPEEYNTDYLDSERTLMQKINQREQHEETLYLNLFQLSCRNIFVSRIDILDDELIVNLDFFDIFDRDAKYTAKLLLDTQIAIQSIFSNSLKPSCSVSCVIDIHSHNEPNFKLLDKIFEHIHADKLYMVNPDKAYQDFHFHHYRSKGSLFAGVEISSIR